MKRLITLLGKTVVWWAMPTKGGTDFQPVETGKMPVPPTIRWYLLSLLLLLTIAVTATCGGGGGGGGGGGDGGANSPPPTTSTDAAAAVQATIMTQETTTISNVDASLAINLASKPAILGAVAGSISQTDFANGWIAVVQGFQLLALQSTPVQTSVVGGRISVFVAGNSWTWSTTSGGLTIAFTMSETTTSNYNWSLTLNGTHNGQSYNNYSIAAGHINRTTLNGKPAWHQTITIIPVPGDLRYIGVEMWGFDDGSSAGYIDFDGYFLGHYYSWTEAVDGTLDTALWYGILGNANKVWGLIINTDGSGSFEAFCPNDWQLAADGTFTTYGLHGSACGYSTACGQPDNPPCGSW